MHVYYSHVFFNDMIFSPKFYQVEQIDSRADSCRKWRHLNQCMSNSWEYEFTNSHEILCPVSQIC